MCGDFTASRQTQNTEARDVLNDVSRRIAAMSAAQGTLYSSRSANKFSSIQFVQAVCNAAEQGFPPGVKIDQKVALCELDNDHAMPLALILNELLTNAVKYGSNGGSGATIRVGFNTEDGFELYVEDDGPGFDFDEVKDRSSGLKLVQLLARQLRGQFYVNRDGPTRCAVRFK